MPGLVIGLLLIIVGGLVAAEIVAVGTVLVFLGLALLVASLYLLHAGRPRYHPTDPEEPIAPQEPPRMGGRG